MTYSVVRTRPADEDLLEIWQYIAQYNLDAADSLLERIDQKCQLLGKNPNLGIRRDDLAPGMFYLIEGKYLIFYRIVDQTVEVLRILHGARNLETIFRP